LRNCSNNSTVLKLPLAKTGRIMPDSYNAPRSTCRIIYARMYSTKAPFADIEDVAAARQGIRW
jgi:hypothetical protein